MGRTGSSTADLPAGVPADGFATADVWRGTDLAGDESWRYRLTPADIAELLAAHDQARSRTDDMHAWTRADFPLPSLAPRIAGWMAELDRGRGFILIRGFPVEAHDEATCAGVYWGLGLHMGRAVSQNTDGDLIGHIRDTGADPNAYGVRLYKTRAEQDFHTDGADVIGLFCLKAAKRGGVSRIVSSPAIFNRLLRERPDLAATVFEPFPFDTQGQHKPGGRPWFDLPLCRVSDGRLRMFFIPWYIRESQQHAEAPRLSRAQEEAVAFIEAAANDPAYWLDMDFQPGDMQFLKNASILHKRTAYEDFDDPALKRHLLRLWLAEPAFSAGDEFLRRGVADAPATRQSGG